MITTVASRRVSWSLTAALMAGLFLLAPVVAHGGAFDSMPPGEQKVARALFEAQKAPVPGGPAPLTLDQIAERKQGREGWGEVFREMKTQGLVGEKNLGQVVSGYEQRHRPAGEAKDGRGATDARGARDNGARSPDTGRGAGIGHGGGVGRGGGKR